MIINGGAINGGVYQDQFGFIANGLVLNLDAVSYSGTGTTWPAQYCINRTTSGLQLQRHTVKIWIVSLR